MQAVNMAWKVGRVATRRIYADNRTVAYELVVVAERSRN